MYVRTHISNTQVPRTWVETYKYRHTCIHTFLHAFKHACMHHRCAHTHARPHTHARIRTHAHARPPARMPTHTLTPRELGSNDMVMCMCMCVCVGARSRVHVRVHVRVRACACVSVRACAVPTCGWACVSACLAAFVWACVRACGRPRAWASVARNCLSACLARVGLRARASAREPEFADCAFRRATRCKTRFPQKAVRAANTLIKRAPQLPHQTDTHGGGAIDAASSARSNERRRRLSRRFSWSPPKPVCQWAVLGIFGTRPGSPTQRIRACDGPITVKLEEKA